MKSLTNIGLIIVISLEMLCLRVPSDYVEVIYPQVKIGGKNIDTSFVRTNDSIPSYYVGDTIMIARKDFSTVTHNNYNSAIANQEYSDSVYTPKACFDLNIGDTFYLIALNIDTSLQSISIEIGNNPGIGIIYQDSISVSSDSIHILYTFVAAWPSKGLVATISTKDWKLKYHLISYCIEARDTITIKTDSIIWSYLLDIKEQDTTWGLNWVKIFGQTNAYSVGIRKVHKRYSISEEIRNFNVSNTNHFDIKAPYSTINSQDTLHLFFIARGMTGYDKVVQLDIPKVK